MEVPMTIRIGTPCKQQQIASGNELLLVIL